MSTADAADRRAFRMVVDQENARRAALIPPETPLPNATNAEYKSSAEIVYAMRMNDAHRDYIRQADETTKREIIAAFDAQPDEAKRAAALAALQ